MDLRNTRKSPDGVQEGLIPSQHQKSNINNKTRTPKDKQGAEWSGAHPEFQHPELESEFHASLGYMRPYPSPEKSKGAKTGCNKTAT